jgi:hypothetical protein
MVSLSYPPENAGFFLYKIADGNVGNKTDRQSIHDFVENTEVTMFRNYKQPPELSPYQ